MPQELALISDIPRAITTTAALTDEALLELEKDGASYQVSVGTVVEKARAGMAEKRCEFVALEADVDDKVKLDVHHGDYFTYNHEGDVTIEIQPAMAGCGHTVMLEITRTNPAANSYSVTFPSGTLITLGTLALASDDTSTLDVLIFTIWANDTASRCLALKQVGQ